MTHRSTGNDDLRVVRLQATEAAVTSLHDFSETLQKKAFDLGQIYAVGQEILPVLGLFLVD